MNTPIEIEPLRFGMTGNIWLSDLRLEFCDHAELGPLDAPAYIARGSVQGHLIGRDQFGPSKHYISHTDVRVQW